MKVLNVDQLHAKLDHNLYELLQNISPLIHLELFSDSEVCSTYNDKYQVIDMTTRQAQIFVDQISSEGIVDFESPYEVIDFTNRLTQEILQYFNEHIDTVKHLSSNLLPINSQTETVLGSNPDSLKNMFLNYTMRNQKFINERLSDICREITMNSEELQRQINLTTENIFLHSEESTQQRSKITNTLELLYIRAILIRAINHLKENNDPDENQIKQIILQSVVDDNEYIYKKEKLKELKALRDAVEQYGGFKNLRNHILSNTGTNYLSSLIDNSQYYSQQYSMFTLIQQYQNIDILDYNIAQLEADLLKIEPTVQEISGNYALQALREGSQAKLEVQLNTLEEELSLRNFGQESSVETLDSPLDLCPREHCEGQLYLFPKCTLQQVLESTGITSSLLEEEQEENKETKKRGKIKKFFTRTSRKTKPTHKQEDDSFEHLSKDNLEELHLEEIEGLLDLKEKIEQQYQPEMFNLYEEKLQLTKERSELINALRKTDLTPEEYELLMEAVSLLQIQREQNTRELRDLGNKYLEAIDNYNNKLDTLKKINKALQDKGDIIDISQAIEYRKNLRFSRQTHLESSQINESIYQRKAYRYGQRDPLYRAGKLRSPIMQHNSGRQEHYTGNRTRQGVTL